MSHDNFSSYGSPLGKDSPPMVVPGSSAGRIPSLPCLARASSSLWPIPRRHHILQHSKGAGRGPRLHHSQLSRESIPNEIPGLLSLAAFLDLAVLSFFPCQPLPCVVDDGPVRLLVSGRFVSVSAQAPWIGRLARAALGQLVRLSPCFSRIQRKRAERCSFCCPCLDGGSNRRLGDAPGWPKPTGD